MKRVLLDENVAHALRKHPSNHETVTAAYAGFAGLKNGELLKAALESGFLLSVVPDGTSLLAEIQFPGPRPGQLTTRPHRVVFS